MPVAGGGLSTTYGISTNVALYLQCNNVTSIMRLVYWKQNIKILSGCCTVSRRHY